MDDLDLSLSKDFPPDRSTSEISAINDESSDHLDIPDLSPGFDIRSSVIVSKGSQKNVRALLKFKEPEPIPIFSCIYCTREYLVFCHISENLFSRKYVIQARIDDLIRKRNLISQIQPTDFSLVNSKSPKKHNDENIHLLKLNILQR